jgi:four helix bundle protein
MVYRDLAVLDAAERLVRLVNDLLDRRPRGELLHVRQLRASVQSIAANIGEAFGRGVGRGRDYSLSIARGEADEAIQHMKANFQADRVPENEYWPIHNLLVVIVKMLKGLLGV